LATAAAAIWGFILLSRTTAYGDWLRFGVLSIGLAAAVLLLVLRGLPGKVLAGIAAVGVVAALAGPAAYSLTTVSEAHTGSIVLAGPAGATRGGGPGFGRPRGVQGSGGQAFGAPPFGGGGGFGPPPQGGPGGFAPPQQGGRGGAGGLLDAATPSTTVVAALSEDAQSYTWVAAAVGSQRAAGLQIATQLPVMAIGGFNGSDPSPTLEQFQQYVADGRIHYFAGGGPGFGGVGQMGGSSASSEIAAWVQENFQSVTIDGTTFYDLTQPVNGPVAVDAGMAT
jgi:hypothetical protein